MFVHVYKTETKIIFKTFSRVYSTNTRSLEFALFGIFLRAKTQVESKSTPKGWTSKPRGSFNGILKLPSSFLETKSREKSQEGAIANLRFTFDKVWWSTSAVFSVPRHDHYHQKLQHSVRHHTAAKLFEMKQTTICHEYGLKLEFSSGQVRYSVLRRAAFSRFISGLFLAALSFTRHFSEYSRFSSVVRSKVKIVTLK